MIDFSSLSVPDLAALWPQAPRLVLVLLLFGALGCALAEASVRLSQRERGARRGWRVHGTLAVGTGLWAGAGSWSLAATAGGLGGTGAFGWAFAAALCSLAAAACLLLVVDAGRALRWPAIAVAAFSQASGWLIWQHALSATPATFGLAAIGALVGASLVAGWVQLEIVIRARRRSRLQQAVGAARIRIWVASAAAGLAGVLPGVALTWFHPPTGSPLVVDTSLLLPIVAAVLQIGLLHAAAVDHRWFVLDRRRREADDAPRLEGEGSIDGLTGLPDRVRLERDLLAIAPGAEARGQRIALLLVCLDGFRTINEAYGHRRGDEVLRDVATRMRAVLETWPGDQGHRLARAGGDEFLLLIRGAGERPGLVKLAEALRATIDEAGQAGGLSSRLSASIGIACFPEDGGVSVLIDHAHAARQAAKEAGGSAVMCFEPRMREDTRERLALLRDLRHAVDGKQLELYYQPKIDARSGQVTAAEALLRWHHPTRGTVSPTVFIPIAERYGLIAALGNWVIEDACRHARVWRDRGLQMRVAINLSAYQMRQDDLVDRIEGALQRHRIDPSRLTCEITETVAMEDTQATQRTFERLGRAGIHLSIDDFGTGYSSLSYLSRLPAAELKIDRSFVTDLDRNPENQAIVTAIIQMAHSLNLRVVAEGVETEPQRDELVRLGCDELQGYMFAKPMSARALLLWALEDRPAPEAFRPSLFAETRPGGAAAGLAAVAHAAPAAPGIERISLD